MAAKINEMEHPPAGPQGVMRRRESRAQVFNVFHDVMGSNEIVTVFGLIFFHETLVMRDQIFVQSRRLAG